MDSSTPAQTLLEAHARLVRFSPRGAILAAGLTDGTLALWTVQKLAGAIGRVATDDSVGDILFAPRLPLLLTLGQRHIRAWRVPDLGPSFDIEVGPIEAAMFAPSSPAGSLPESHAESLPQTDPVHPASSADRDLAPPRRALPPEDRLLIVAVDGRLLVVDMIERRVVSERTLESPEAGRPPLRVLQLAIAPSDGAVLALCCSHPARSSPDGPVVGPAWTLHRFTLDGHRLVAGPPLPLPGKVRALACQSRGDRVALANGQVRVLSYPHGTLVGAYDERGAVPVHADVTPNGRAHGGWCRPIFTVDGRLLIGGAADGTIHLWDMARGNLVRTLQGLSSPVTSLDLMHGRALLAASSEDGTACLWDLRQSRRR